MSPSRLATRGPLGLLCVLALPALLAACATARKPTPKYVPPSGGPTAKLVMRGAVPAGDAYGVYLLQDSERCADYRMVGVGGSARNPASTTLAANQITTVEFMLVKPTRQFCNIRWTFTPVEGKTYLLRGAAIGSSCAALVQDMSDPENIKPEPTALRRNPTGSACLPISQSKGINLKNTNVDSSGDAVLRQGAGAEDLQGLIGQ